jgi:hypothetical protein
MVIIRNLIPKYLGSHILQETTTLCWSWFTWLRLQHFNLITSSNKTKPRIDRSSFPNLSCLSRTHQKARERSNVWNTKYFKLYHTPLALFFPSCNTTILWQKRCLRFSSLSEMNLGKVKDLEMSEVQTWC